MGFYEGSVLLCGPSDSMGKLLMAAIAAHADVYGFTFVSQVTLARIIGRDERSVKTYQKHLADEGWITVYDKAFKRKGNVYRLNLDRLGVTIPDKYDCSLLRDGIRENISPDIVSIAEQMEQAYGAQQKAPQRRRGASSRRRPSQHAAGIGENPSPDNAPSAAEISTRPQVSGENPQAGQGKVLSKSGEKSRTDRGKIRTSPTPPNRQKSKEEYREEVQEDHTTPTGAVEPERDQPEPQLAHDASKASTPGNHALLDRLLAGARNPEREGARRGGMASIAEMSGAEAERPDREALRSAKPAEQWRAVLEALHDTTFAKHGPSGEIEWGKTFAGAEFVEYEADGDAQVWSVSHRDPGALNRALQSCRDRLAKLLLEITGKRVQVRVERRAA